MYASQNGGEYAFTIDQERGGGIPLEQVFWDDFLSNKAGWGLRVYEQDWLYNTFAEKVGALQQDPTLGRTWLTQVTITLYIPNVCIYLTHMCYICVCIFCV